LWKDVVDWLTKDSGLRITEQDIKSTVALYMRGRLEIANDVIFACSKQCQEIEGRRNSLGQNAVENSLWKHSLSQNARTVLVRLEPVVNVIGSAVGVSVNTEVVPIISPWTINGPRIGMLCKQFRSGMKKDSGGHLASPGAVLVKNGQGHGVPGGGVL